MASREVAAQHLPGEAARGCVGATGTGRVSACFAAVACKCNVVACACTAVPVEFLTSKGFRVELETLAVPVMEGVVVINSANVGRMEVSLHGSVLHTFRAVAWRCSLAPDPKDMGV